eukprot:1563341-Alexandrium_andersonii.AAC.1
MRLSGASGANFEAPLGPRTSRFDRLKRSCMFGKADCGLVQISVLMSIGRIADCTFGCLAV